MVEKDKKPRPLQDSQGPRTATPGSRPTARPIRPRRSLRLHAAKDEGDRGKPISGRRVEQAVITVPALLFQRCPAPGHQGCRARSRGLRSCASSTSRLAAAAGPMALDKQKAGHHRGSYDLGGWHFSTFSILEIGDGRPFEGEVRPTATTFPGRRGLRTCASSIIPRPTSSRKEQGIDLRRDTSSRCSGSREAAEKAKIELSSTTQTEINLPFITADRVRSQAP